jgi:DNA sulfur modification protein DndD
MIFTELVLENFGSYANRNVINLRPKNHEVMHPIILFGGMNGGGKTTFMDAIRLALYGQRAKCSTRGNLGYGNFLIQSIHSRNSNMARIELTFEHIVDDHWQELKIVRAWDKKLRDGKDSLSIIVDGDYDDALANTWDEYIENILPLGISNLFLFDGEQVKGLAELDTPPQSVVEAISTLLGLELAEKLAVDLEVLVNRKRKSLASKSQLATIEEIEAKLNNLDEKKQELKLSCQQLQEKLKKAQKKQEAAFSKFRTEGGKIAAERDELEAKIKELANTAEEYRQDLVSYAAGSSPLLQILPLLFDAAVQGKKEVKLQQFQQSKEIIAARDEKLLNYLGGLDLNPEYINKIEFFLATENKIIDDLIAAQGKVYLNINEEQLQQLNNFIENKLPLQQQLINDKIARLKQIEIEKDNLDRQIAIAAPPEAYQQLQDSLDKAEKQLDRAKTEYERERYNYQQLDRQIDLVKKELNNYSETAIDRVNDEHIISSIDRVQKTLAVFRERLTLKKLNKLEVEVSECFRYLLHKSNLVHKVTIDRDDFRISLYDPHGKFLPKQRLSAGEKQLLAIALLWGLARVSERNLPIAIDTPLSRLDSSHRSNLVERYFPAASHQVILLSTDTEIGELEVTKLRDTEAIALEYLLEYDRATGQTTVKSGYFW